MELAMYITILTAVSILAPFVIEGIKKLLGNKAYDVNVLSATTTAIIAFLACVAVVIVTKTQITSIEIVYIIGTVFFSVLGSLCGYDKMFKFIFEAIRKKKGNK